MKSSGESVDRMYMIDSLIRCIVGPLTEPELKSYNQTFPEQEYNSFCKSIQSFSNKNAPYSPIYGF